MGENYAFYPIVPMGAPRMTRADAWRGREVVLRYRAFKEECRLRRVDIQNGDRVVFVLPMPPSWSKKKKAEMDGKPHLSKPDRDNIEKAVLDAMFEDDAHIWDLHTQKIWGYEGCIRVYRNT